MHETVGHIGDSKILKNIYIFSSRELPTSCEERKYIFCTYLSVLIGR